MNIAWSRKILSELHAEGVRDIVFCPGARNSPLVSVLAETRGFELFSFFEERNAAYFALGIARRKGQPVVVITTSGTAVAELLPAVVESFHVGAPLILLTADRPRRLRGTGAPQSIDQTGLFAKFAEPQFDLENGEDFSLSSWNRRSPVHINVCFDEPLIDEPIESLDLAPEPARSSYAGRSEFAISTGKEWAALRLSKFLRANGPLVVVVGTLETEDEREATAEFLLKLGAPVYLEATSGLRERSDLERLALKSGDQLLAWGLRRKLYSRVLRIGGVPTVRIWRDLDQSDCGVEVFSLSSLPFAGLGRGEMVCAEIASVLHDLGVPSASIANPLAIKDRAHEEALLELYLSEPRAEPSLVHHLSYLIPESSLVYLGNSLPIREWDLAAGRKRRFAVEANRGVNGIDGQLSTFLGLAREDVENWALVGDLTALYDLAAPWALRHRSDLQARIVILNNSGGKIFSRIFKTDLFENKHDIGFASWAQMWKLDYQKWTEVPSAVEFAEQATVIEIVPDEAATNRFWECYDGFWKS